MYSLYIGCLQLCNMAFPIVRFTRIVTSQVFVNIWIQLSIALSSDFYRGGKKIYLWLIDWIEFYAVSTIFQLCNGSECEWNVISFEILTFPWWPSPAYSSSKSSETVDCVPRVGGVLSLTSGYILRPIRQTWYIYDKSLALICKQLVCKGLARMVRWVIFLVPLFTNK